MNKISDSEFDSKWKEIAKKWRYSTTTVEARECLEQMTKLASEHRVQNQQII